MLAGQSGQAACCGHGCAEQQADRLRQRDSGGPVHDQRSRERERGQQHCGRGTT
jgi:hypothetical protein